MSQQGNGSGPAINELSRSKERYKHQDQLLYGFMQMPGSTAKEVAAEFYDWKYEKYGDSPKRATDLASEKLGYLVEMGNRECRRSGKEAHTYRITERGIAHLRSVGLLSGGVVSSPKAESAAPVKSGRAFLAGMADILAS